MLKWHNYINFEQFNESFGIYHLQYIRKVCFETLKKNQEFEWNWRKLISSLLYVTTARGLARLARNYLQITEDEAEDIKKHEGLS